MSIKKSAIDLCLIFVMFFIFPLIGNAAVMYVQCGNTKLQSDNDTLYIFNLTNENHIERYPFLNGKWIGANYWNGMEKFDSNAVCNPTCAYWDEMDGVCPATCKYLSSAIGYTSLACNGKSSPTNVFSYDGFLYYYNFRNGGEALWFESDSGVILNERNGNFKNIAIDTQLKKAKSFAEMNFSNSQSRLWLDDVFHTFVNRDYSMEDMENNFNNWFSNSSDKSVLLKNEKDAFVLSNQTTLQQCNAINSGTSNIDNDNFILSVIDKIDYIENFYNLADSGDASLSFNLFFKKMLSDDNKTISDVNYSSGFMKLLFKHFEWYAKEHNYSVIKLSDSDKNELKELMIKYKNNYRDCLVKLQTDLKDGKIDLSDNSKKQLNNGIDRLNSIGLEYFPVDDCGTLIGKELMDKLQEYFNIIKIVVPIIVIVFSVLDFGKVVLSSDADEMKKAQAKLVKRLIIAVIIFFIPLFVNFILNMVNSVFSFISGDNCGIH